MDNKNIEPYILPTLQYIEAYIDKQIDKGASPAQVEFSFIINQKDMCSRLGINGDMLMAIRNRLEFLQFIKKMPTNESMIIINLHSLVKNFYSPKKA